MLPQLRGNSLPMTTRGFGMGRGKEKPIIPSSLGQRGGQIERAQLPIFLLFFLPKPLLVEGERGLLNDCLAAYAQTALFRSKLWHSYFEPKIVLPRPPLLSILSAQSLYCICC